MGNVFRQYWIPAIRSDELPSPDCPPLRVKLLGEELIGFRTTSGEVGLVQNSCPHRGASLFFGRNEEEGLRYVYVPTVARHAARKSALRHLVHTFFEGSGAKVVASLLGGDAARLSDEELDEIATLVRNARGEAE